jgi:magnesium chelatase family protein
MHVEVPRPAASALFAAQNEESSATVGTRVRCARERQSARQGKPNACLTNREVHEHCRLKDSARTTLERATAALGLSPRAHHRILKVARTIADLASVEEIGPLQISEAIALRRFDRNQANNGGASAPPRK